MDYTYLIPIAGIIALIFVFIKKSVATIPSSIQICFMTRKIFILLSIFVFTFSAFGLAERDFRSKTGNVIRGTVLEYLDGGDVLFKRSSDLQLFRIDLKIFTEDDQAFVKNNYQVSQSYFQ